MKVYIFENNYYIGNDPEVTKKALRSEDVEVPEDKQIKIVNGKITFVDADMN